MSAELLSWMAGTLESEGSVRINPPTKKNLGTLLVDMVNTDVEMVQPFQDRWPGYMRFVPQRGRRRGYFRYRVAAWQALLLLNGLMPHFRTARFRERAMLGIDFQSQKAIGARSPEYRADQLMFYKLMAELNRRGVPT